MIWALAGWFSMSFGGTEPFKEGVHYEVLDQPKPVAAVAIEVKEFFGFGCPICAQIFPTLQEWQTRLADDVQFVGVPVAFKEKAQLQARAFYVAKQLKCHEVYTERLFEFMQGDRQLYGEQEDLLTLLADIGVPMGKAKEAFNAPIIDTKIEQDKREILAKKIYAIPAFIIDQRYKVTMQHVKGDLNQLLSILDHLIDKARLEHQLTCND